MKNKKNTKLSQELKDDEKRRKKKAAIILLIFLVFFIIISVAISKYGIIGFIPTGNKDVFNLYGNDTSCVVDPDPETDGELTVYDRDQIWSSVNSLNIFNNPMYYGKKIIAPGSTNSYKFEIYNGFEDFIDYKITFIEDNPHNVNMMYRLKKNNKVIISDWVTYDKLNQKNLTLNSLDTDVYILEWKWIDADNDTEIGFLDNATYGLSIKILAVGGTDDEGI